MTNPDYRHLILIADRSGSMQSCASDAVGGYNAYAAKLPEAARVSLTLFDSEGVDLIRDAVAGSPELEQMAGGAGSEIGLGGMLTKVIAAKRAARSGAHTIIASGHD
mgnify:CR=1 FL=1